MTDVLKNKRKTFIFVFLAIALVLATWYKLKIQGITMTEDISADVSYEEVLICENTDVDHVHSTECYEKVAVVSSDEQSAQAETEKQSEQIAETDINNLNITEDLEELKKDENTNTEKQLEQKNKTDVQKNVAPEIVNEEKNNVSVYSVMGENNIEAFKAPTSQITVKYEVNISTTTNGNLDSKYIFNGTLPSVGESGQSTYSITISANNGTIIEEISNDRVKLYDSKNNNGVSKDQIILVFNGWIVNGNRNRIVQPNTELNWNTLSQYARNGSITLTPIWEQKTKLQLVNFYVQYESIAVDTQGNVQTRNPENYTPSLWVSELVNAPSYEINKISGSDEKNSYEPNQLIHNLAKDNQDGNPYFDTIPSDEYILQKVQELIGADDEKAKKFSVDGQKIDPNDIDLDHFAVRWYVFKLENDSYHIDIKLVRKEGKMNITKTFLGLNSDKIEKSGFYINVYGASGDTNINLSVTDRNVTKKDNTYTWTIDVKYGINYKVIEHNYNIENYTVSTVYNIFDPVPTQFKKKYDSDGNYNYVLDNETGNYKIAYTNQTIVSQKATDNVRTIVQNIVGINNYDMDNPSGLDISNILTLNITNTYAPKSAITIKKEDSVTNNGLANAQFSLYEVNNDGINKDSPLKFTYNESIYTYNEQGNITVLTSPTGGSIIINGLTTGKTYKLVEITVPDGYDGNNSVEVTLEVNSAGVIVPVITKGEKYDKTNNVLEVDNASKLANVKVTKKWEDVPEEYVKDVIVELYLNNIPISNYNLNYDLNGDGTIDSNDVVQKQVTLNSTNNWEHIWNNLPLYVDGIKAKYSVREIQIGDVKAVTNGSYNSVDGIWNSGDAYTQYRAHTTKQEETTDLNGNTQVSFDLVNTIQLIRININKVSPLGVPIDGVKFRLQKVDDLGNIDTTFTARELVTSLDGKLSFVDLEYDTKYVITEIEANKGYYLDNTPIYVIINKGEQGQEDTLTLYTDETFTTEAVEGSYEYVSLNDAKDTLNIINISHTPMPKAGGCGVYSFYILGIFLMGCSTIIIYLRKNKIKKGM